MKYPERYIKGLRSSAKKLLRLSESDNISYLIESGRFNSEVINIASILFLYADQLERDIEMESLENREVDTMTEYGILKALGAGNDVQII